MLKKAIVQTVLLVSALSLAGTAPVMATGIPVVDIAGLAQELTEYSQLLTQYKELLKQTGLNTQQLKGILDQYTQTLRDYQMALMQANSLKNKLAPMDWNAFLTAANLLQEYGPFSGKDMRSASDPTIRKSVQAANARYGALDDEATLNQEAREVYGKVPQALTRSYNQAEQAVHQIDTTHYLSSQLKTNQDKARTLDQKRAALGDKSELATLQMIVDQNQELIQQMTTLNQTMKEQYAQSNQLANVHFNAVQQAQQAHLKQMKWLREHPPQLNHQPLTP